MLMKRLLCNRIQFQKSVSCFIMQNKKEILQSVYIHVRINQKHYISIFLYGSRRVKDSIFISGNLNALIPIDKSREVCG